MDESREDLVKYLTEIVEISEANARKLLFLKDDRGNFSITSRYSLYEFIGYLKDNDQNEMIKYFTELPPSLLREDQILFEFPSLNSERERFHLLKATLRGNSQYVANSGHKCPNKSCQSTNVSFREVQIRSADEPMTTLFNCETCGKRWRQ
ncbi:MAG: zinc ribbon domain-containing protein [Patescibacteria group bacterium]